MFFLNLTAGEFVALLGALGGLITALYLLDRAKRKKVVSTLRFWTSAITAEEKQTRRRMRDPWSLILQLAGLILLLLAIAQLQWGTRERKQRDHVLLLDTSAWSAAVEGGEGQRVIDREKELARAYIGSLPSRDRVMLVLADALATPVTPFTSDRAQIRSALNEASAGFSALNIQQAIIYAQQAQAWSGGQPGEIAYAGPKQIDSADVTLHGVSNLRVLSIPLRRENVGIRRMTVKRGEDAADEWQATVTVRNYGSARRSVRVKTRFGTTVFAPRILNLASQQEAAAEYVFVTSDRGDLVAELDPPDVLASDNRAVLALPRSGLLRVAIYTARPEVLRPLLEANQRVSAQFYNPSQYQPNPRADVILLDRFAPPKPPAIASLWIQPARDASPLPIKTTLENATITNWNSNTSLGVGLHATETRLASAESFETFQGDIPIASAGRAPVVVARPATSGLPKMALIGFDPFEGEMKFQVTTPLLFANLLHWLSPESLRMLDLSAARVGSATVTLEPTERADQIRISSDNGDAIPFTIHDRTLQLFTGRPSIIRIASYDRERVLSLTLPDVAEHEFQPPAISAAGLPVRANWAPNSVTLWQWLAVLGALTLVIEWMLFGWRRIWRREAAKSAPKSNTPLTRTSEERQLVSR